MKPIIAQYDQSLSQEALKNTYLYSKFEKERKVAYLYLSVIMTCSLVHQKPGRTFNRKQSGALRSAEVGAVWHALVGFKEILEREGKSMRLKRIADSANIWTEVDGKPEVVLSQLFWYSFWVQLRKDSYWIQALKNLKVVYFMLVSIVSWKIGLVKLILYWFLMESQASLTKILVLI